MTTKEIFNLLPYSRPFLFVDELTEISENGAKGIYTFRSDEYFYPGHFKDLPVTPGVILTETMAQIGLVCLGIYLVRDEITANALPAIALSALEIEFYLPVLPGEKVTVSSQKKYFRFNKLKCDVEMRNHEGKVVCDGTMSGILKYNK